MSEVKKNEATEVAVASGFAAVANAGGLNYMTFETHCLCPFYWTCTVI